MTTLYLNEQQSVVKKRDFTPCPMIVTGRAAWNWAELKRPPSASLRFITSK